MYDDAATLEESRGVFVIRQASRVAESYDTTTLTPHVSCRIVRKEGQTPETSAEILLSRVDVAGKSTEDRRHDHVTGTKQIGDTTMSPVQNKG
jgi:hypothetical protein